MREIKYLVIHTTASPPTWSWQTLQRFFLNTLKWKREGYHVIIQPDGFVKRFIPNEQISNGVAPYNIPQIGQISNSNSINICYIGGIDRNGKGIDNRTEVQKETLKSIVQWYLKEFPNIVILGHNQVANKACPCFSVPKWLRSFGVSEKNIYAGDNFNVLKINNY